MRVASNFQRDEIQRATETMTKAQNPATTQDFYIQDYYEHSEDAEYAEGNAGESQLPSICERSLPY